MAVNSFDSGNLSPLFTTSVADPTTDPVLSFDLTAVSPYTVYGNNTASSADPDFFTPDLSTALFTGILPIARGGTGAAVGAILNQIASPQTAGFSITGNGTLGGTLAVSTKANIGSPSGTTGALNTNQDGVWSFRNADPNRYIRFNTSGTFNDFLSTGVPLVINYGFAVAAQNVNFFGGSAAHAGIVTIGSNAQTNARLNVKGSTTNSSAFVVRLFSSADIELFSVRNDGYTQIATTNSLYIGGNMASAVTPVGDVNILAGNILNSASSSGFESRVAFGNSVTSAYSFRSSPSTIGAIFTLPSMIHYGVSNATLGASSSITSQYGVHISDLSSATNNYGIYSAVTSGANKYNLYMAGTAANYLAGALDIGGTLTGTSATFNGTIFLANQSAPSTPTGGGVIYVESGALKYKGSSGTVTVIAVA